MRPVIGGGPEFRKAGRTPIYEPLKLDAWAEGRIGPPVRSTSDRGRVIDACETRRAGGATGLGYAVCLAANNPQLNLQKKSSQEANGAFRQFQEARVAAAGLFPARPRLRLVERVPPRPRRLEVTLGIPIAANLSAAMGHFVSWTAISTN